MTANTLRRVEVWFAAHTAHPAVRVGIAHGLAVDDMDVAHPRRWVAEAGLAQMTSLRLNRVGILRGLGFGAAHLG